MQAEQDHYTGLCCNHDNKQPQNKREALAYCQGLGKPYSRPGCKNPVCQNDSLHWVNTPTLDSCFGLVGHHQQGAECDPVECVCVCVCVCVCMCVRSQTPFSSRHASGPSLFLSTGKHPVVGQLPRVSFSALPGQSSDRPNLPPHKKTFDFSVFFRQYSESTLRSMQ